MTPPLRDVLRAFLSSTTALGAETGSLSPERQRMLVDEHKRLESTNSRYLILWTALLCITFFAALVLGIANALGIAGSIASAGALGGSAFGCQIKLLSVWRTKTATEQLLALALAFEGPALVRVVEVLAKQADTRESVSATPPISISTAAPQDRRGT